MKKKYRKGAMYFLIILFLSIILSVAYFFFGEKNEELNSPIIPEPIYKQDIKENTGVIDLTPVIISNSKPTTVDSSSSELLDDKTVSVTNNVFDTNISSETKNITDKNISLSKNGKILVQTVLISKNTLNNKVAQVEIPAGIAIKTKKNTFYTKEIKVPTFIDPKQYKLDNKSAVSLIEVGSDQESLFFKNEKGQDEYVTIRMPAPGYNQGEKVNIYSSENGKEWKLHTQTMVQEIDNSSYVVFTTNHFTLFTVGSIQWDNDNFITDDFWNNNPTNQDVIRALYGDGSGGIERTAYTRNRTGVTCITGNMSVVYLTEGTGSLPIALAANTIYILGSGNYITTGAIAMNGCSAVIGGTGNINFYSSVQLSTATQGMFYATTKNNIIIDGISVNGSGNGWGGSHTKNANGIYFQSIVNSTIHDIQLLNNNKGIYLNTTSNSITLDTIQSYNNTNYGIQLQTSSNNILNNIQSYNNAYGIYLFSTSNYNSLNNIQSYNNSDNGIVIQTTSSYNSLNNIQSYNNSSYGIYIFNNSHYNVINNAQSYNNALYGIILNSTSGTILNRVSIKNNQTGLSLGGTLTNNKYYDTLIFSENDQNIDGILTGLITGNLADISFLGWTGGSIEIDSGCFRCANITNPVDIASGTLTNTGIYRSCNSRGKIGGWTSSPNSLSYIYGINVPKQIQPVFYILSQLTGSNSYYSGSLYIGEINKIEENTDMTCNDCFNKYTVNWDNSNFITGAFWDQNPNSCDMVAALYGTGRYGEDRTMYSSNRSGVQNGNLCNTENIRVITISPGTGTLPNQLSSHTIYLLEPGNYITTGTINTEKCNAIVTKNGTGVFYSTGPLANGMFYVNTKKNNIFDNIHISATGNGLGGSHTANGYGIFFVSSPNNALHAIESYNASTASIYLNSSSNNSLYAIQSYKNQYGIYLNSSSNNILDTIDSYNNSNHSIYLLSSSNYNILRNVNAYNSSNGIFINTSSSGNILNTIKTYNNTSVGVYLGSNSYSTTLDNIQSYNNTGYGIQIGALNNVMNNIQSYDNNNYGIYISASNNSLNNIQSYNNAQDGLQIASSNTILNNIQSYNNNGAGIGLSNATNTIFNQVSILNNTTGISFVGTSTGSYYGLLKLYENDADRQNSGGKIAAGLNDYSAFGWTTGTIGINTCFRCADITNPINIGSGLLTNTGIYRSCNSKGKIIGWKPAMGESITYIYGTNVPKQVVPVQYSGANPVISNLSYSGNLYIGEVDKIGEDNNTTCNNCISNYSAIWNNDVYINSGFWSQTPNTCDIISALYGTGIYGEDKTAYTINWSNPSICDVENMRVSTVSPGTNILPNQLVSNTIYVLDPGTYITNGTINPNTCNAVIVKNDSGTFYSNTQLGNGLFFVNAKKNTIFENISFNGTGDGQGGSHAANSYGIYLNASNNTVHAVQSYNNVYGMYLMGNRNILDDLQFYNNTSTAIQIQSASNNMLNNAQFSFNNDTNISLSSSHFNTLRNIQTSKCKNTSTNCYGIYLDSSNNNILDNIQTSDNKSYGIYLRASSNNILNNIQTYNNSIHGIYIYSNSQYNTLNNIQSYNNLQAGIAYSSSNYNVVNNSQLYNNTTYGLSLISSSGTIINNAQIYNNQQGLYFNSSNYNVLNHVSLLNNNLGVSFSVSTGNTYYGTLKLYANDDDGIITFLTGGTSSVYTNIGRTGGMVENGECFRCGNIANPFNLSNGLLTNTGVYDYCNSRGQIATWKPTTGELISYVYGISLPKQLAPVQYSGSLLTGSSISYSGNLYIGEINKIAENTDTTCTSCEGQYTISWDNDKFLDASFWSQNPNNCDIHAALYGTNSADKTAYTKYWQTNACSSENALIKQVSPGTNVLPSIITPYTIYVLNPGDYITDSEITINKCNAIIARNGMAKFFTSSYFSNSGVFYGKLASNNILDSIYINGTDNGLGGSHSKDYYSLYLAGTDNNNVSKNNTLHNIEVTNANYAIYIFYAKYNTLDTLKLYGNSQGGRLAYFSNNILNNIQSYDGTNGLNLDNSASNNSINNLQLYNNSNYGLEVYMADNNTFNNIDLYNNRMNRIYNSHYTTLNNVLIYGNGDVSYPTYMSFNIGYAVNTVVNNAHIFNNQNNGISLDRSTGTIINNVNIYNNMGYAISSTFSTGSKFYGKNSFFNNSYGNVKLDNTSSFISGGLENLGLGRNVGEIIAGSGKMNCGLAVNILDRNQNSFLNLISNCDYRGYRSNISLTGTNIYGGSISKQIQPVMYSGTTNLVLSSLDFDSTKFIAEPTSILPGADFFINSDTYTTTRNLELVVVLAFTGSYTISGDIVGGSLNGILNGTGTFNVTLTPGYGEKSINLYLSTGGMIYKTFNNTIIYLDSVTIQSEKDIIQKYYFSGYNWLANSCDINKMMLKYLSPGLGTVPQNLQGNTLYILSSGDYLNTGVINFLGHCTALIGSGLVTFYNTTGSTSALSIDNLNNILIDGIKFDGKSNGSSGFHTPISAGISFINGSSFGIINDVETYNYYRGIYFNNGVNYTTISNSQSYNNSQEGIHIYISHYNFVDNVQLFQNSINGSYGGIRIYNSNYTTLNNIQSFNNTNNGIYIDGSNSGVINNAQLYNNGYGIGFNNRSQYNVVNNLECYNNTINAIYVDNRYYTHYTKYFGTIKMYANGSLSNISIPNASYFATGGATYNYLGRTTGILLLTGPTMSCDYAVNPFSSDELFLHVDGLCNSQKDLDFYPPVAGYIYGKNSNRQVQSVIYNYISGTGLVSSLQNDVTGLYIGEYTGGYIPTPGYVSYEPAIITTSSVTGEMHRADTGRFIQLNNSLDPYYSFVTDGLFDFIYQDAVLNTTGSIRSSVDWIKVDSTLPIVNFTGISFAYPLSIYNPGILTGLITILENNLVNFSWLRSGESIASVYDSGLVLMLNFDTVSALGENSSKVVDLSLYKQLIKIYGATPINDGRRNGAFSFDGISNKIRIPSVKLTGDFTYSVWVNKTTLGTGNYTIIGGAPFGVATTQGGIALAFFGATDRIYFDTYSSTARYTAFADGPFNPNTWYHIVATRDQAAGKLYLWINGILAGSGNTFTGPIVWSKYANSIGATSAYYGDNYYFSGRIDEVRIWNRALSSGEIETLYNSNLNKYDIDKWFFSINSIIPSTTFTGVGSTYSFQVCTQDVANLIGCTRQKTVVYGTEPDYVNVPNISDISVVENEFSYGGYKFSGSIASVSGFLVGTKKIRLNDSNGELPIPIIMQSTGDNKIEVQMDSGLVFTTTSGDYYTGILYGPSFSDTGSFLLSGIASAIFLGSNDTSLQIKNQSGNTASVFIRVPLQGIELGTLISIYYSEDHGVTWNYHTGSTVVSIEGLSYVEFETTHFTDFAIVGVGELQPEPLTGSFMINNDESYTLTSVVLLSLDASGATNMRFSNDNENRSEWLSYTGTYEWTLTGDYGTKIVYAEIDFDSDLTGDISTFDSIEYLVLPPGQSQGNIKLEITGGVTECVYGTSLTMDAQEVKIGIPYTFTGTFPSAWYCQDYRGITSEWTLTIQTTDLTNEKSNVISGGNLLISHDPVVVEGDPSCTGDNGTATQFYNAPYVLFAKASGSNKICKVSADNVSLLVNVPANQAPGNYSGTLTLTMNGF
ncbi:parallel beta-helix repeat-containing protein [candidate division SR1 bacterium RAAC1_SR1_1]|nr:parallel beta-helix repeat-containing protein [candidate division SR1 bacterium RAAC1_SR1_1]